jgi:hypothetical protein
MVVNGTQVIEQPPVDVFAVEVFRPRAHLDIGKPAQAQHPETQDIGQEFRPQAEQALQQLGAIFRVKIIRHRTSRINSVMATPNIPSLRVSRRAFENMVFPAC